MVRGEHIALQANIGVALSPEQGGDPAALLCHVDDALYQATLQGTITFSCISTALRGTTPLLTATASSDASSRASDSSSCSTFFLTSLSRIIGSSLLKKL
ncbi:hypothetical protein INH39_26805 [Massilia violaceinigra]|uniref:GGDEF domain-containing protein n=1 Tax=Massilia violaceinigra TaxID=2045208 RepID=A0ABY4A4P9_9BURK|nr:hypothetical protein INH39_26805 [Massilia violaceinigra]